MLYSVLIPTGETFACPRASLPVYLHVRKVTRDRNDGNGCAVENDDNVTTPAAMIDDDDRSGRGSIFKCFEWSGPQEVSKVR